MAQVRIVYRHNEAPNRGFAATGVFFIKFILAIPHLMIMGALQALTQVLAYVGFWLVALTGSYPTGLLSLIDTAFQWSARGWGWISGITDDYPPFDEEAPDAPVSLELPTPDQPSKGWAVAGIFVVPKLIVLIPHLVALAFMTIAAVLAMWWGFVMVMFGGRLPGGIQDFLAGTMQWWARVYAWLAGLTDEYPPFRLDARPTA
jgi:hypothetical protein